MKSFDEIVKQTPVFLNCFGNEEDVFTEFNENDIDNIKILFASYGCENYSGDAYVLFEKDSKLYEVYGNHCSCYGLEDQWKDEEVMLEEIEHRLLEGTFGEENYAGNEFKKDLCEFLGVDYIVNGD